MKGVLVAVGLGERVARRPRGGSASVWPARERPPIDLAIEAFARSGFDEICVVLGHNGDVLWQYLGDSARYGIAVYCVHNVQYVRGSATAIYAARAFVGGEPFVVSLSGYPVTANMLLSLVGQPWGAHVLCTDGQGRGHKASRGAMKVWVDEQGRVCRIGQRLRHWHALATGAFLFQPDVFGHISGLLQHSDGHCSITDLLRRMIACGQAPCACDVPQLWEDGVGAQDLLVWTAPVLSVRMPQGSLFA